MESAQFIERTACIACDSQSFTELCGGKYEGQPLFDFLSADPWGENPIPFLIGNPWSYVQCNACKQAFHKYILAPDWNERRFSEWMTQEAIAEFERPYKTPEKIFEKAAQHTKHVLQLEYLTRSLRGNEAVRLLDFGCGYGEFLAMCGLYGFEAYGVDRSSAKRGNSLFDRILPELDDIKGLDNPRFHVITLFEVLEHLDDPKPLLKALSEYLIPGGILVLETPDCLGITNMVTREDYLRIHPLEHINGFTAETMCKFAESLGFKQIKKPASHVTADLARVAKTEIKSALAGVMGVTTQQYFQKI